MAGVSGAIPGPRSDQNRGLDSGHAPDDHRRPSEARTRPRRNREATRPTKIGDAAATESPWRSPWAVPTAKPEARGERGGSVQAPTRDEARHRKTITKPGRDDGRQGSDGEVWSRPACEARCAIGTVLFLRLMRGITPSSTPRPFRGRRGTRHADLKSTRISAPMDAWTEAEAPLRPEILEERSSCRVQRAPFTP